MISRLLGLTAIAACVLLVPENRTRAQTTSAQGFQDVVVFSGLDHPTAVRFSPDGRVFVTEKSGLIKVFDNLADTTASVFADLRTQVHNYWDRGLLGFALDPNFPAEPFVYVLYTRDADIGRPAPKWGSAGITSDQCPTPPGGTAEGCTVSGRLSRLQASGNVMTGAEQVLIDGWFQQYPSHSMGSIVFGPDDALYASGGDGASWQFVDYGQKGIPTNPGGDPPVPVGGAQNPPSAEGGALRAQDLRTSGDPAGLNGAVIRVDRRTGDPLPDNPNGSTADVNARRIIAYGLRNPFRMAFRPGTHELWIGDVGWQDWEELNVVDPRAGVKNFGWPCYEDRIRQPGYDAANLTLCEQLYAQPGAVTFAYWQYKEGVSINAGEACPNTDAAMTGLAFYQGGSYPAEFDNALFFADYTRRCVWAMFPGANGLPDPTRISTIITGAKTPVDLQVGPGGDIFYVDINGGTIHRLVFNSNNQAPTAVIRATPTSGPLPLIVNFDGSQSSDPDATAPLAYAWDLDGDGVFGNSTAVNPSRTYTVAGTYRVGLRVTDAGGLSSTAFVNINAGNTPPTANIATPTAALRWRVGQQVSFSGSGTDPEDGTLPASAMRWALIMHHCSTATSCHEHPIQEYAGVSSGSFVAPDHGYPSFLELTLTVTDSRGVSSTRALRLDPQTVTITLDSSPGGLRVAAGSQSFTTPSPQTHVVGSAISISAPSPQTLSGTSYVFNSWSDGGAQTHTITAPATAQTYTARFTATSPAPGAPDIVIYAAKAPVRAGSWRVVPDSTAAGGARMEHPEAGAPKLAAQATPADYFEVTFDAQAGVAYRLWMRGRALNNAYTNDSVSVQFDRSVDTAGVAVNRIGTTQATTVSIEDCAGCGLSAWGWQDNGYGANVFGPAVFFAATGRQRMRVQGREDGISIDQIVLSASTYMTTRPGATKNDTTILPEAPPTTAPAGGDIVVHARRAAIKAGTWRLVADTTAAGGQRLEHPDAGAAKVSAPLATPSHHVELTFNAEAGRAYRLWMRGRAAGNSYLNDSVFVQFDSSVTASGTPAYRIGTTDATSIVLEECGGCGLSGWGWADNGYGTGVLGPLVYFSRTGVQTMRIQPRDDGMSLDQIVLSPSTYVQSAPGATKNDTTILPETGTSAPPPPPPPSSAGEVVLHAATASVRAGAWRVTADATAAGGARMEHPDAGGAKITTAFAAPTHYFELTFQAEAGRPYHLWLRGRAESDYWGNDSVFAQFDGTVTEQGAATSRIGTTSATEINLEDCGGCSLSGWGWQDNGWGTLVMGPHIYFATTGTQRIRIQTREDGLSIDQIVLSPATYLTKSPGTLKQDSTILPRTQ